MKQINDVIKFIDFLQNFAGITRQTPGTKNREYLETDAEHSFQLAMTCWYLIEKYNLDLDVEKTLKYALSHDLVEIYAGDTDPFKSNKNYLSSQGDRELKATKKIAAEWSDFKELGKTVENFEKRDNKESSLVHMIDKILPVMNTFLAKHTFYTDRNVTLAKWFDWLDGQEGKVTKTLPQEIKDLVESLREFLKVNSKGFFSNK